LRVLVTGGAGFLGSHLSEALLAQGHHVVVVDNLLTGSVANVDHLRGPKFEFHQADICEAFDFGAVDYVFHLATPAGPSDCVDHPFETLRAGSFGTFNTLTVAEKYGARFLLASASEIYGDPQVHPQTEDYWGFCNPIGVRSAYIEAKRLSEVATMAYRRYCGVDTRIARISSVYGPRMRTDDGRLIPNLVLQALRGEDLTINGDGSQTRSLTYVSDAVTGMLKLAWSNEHSPVNLGWPHEVSILECARQVLAVTGSDSKISFCALPEDDSKRRCPDITRARRLLKWEPGIDLGAGLRISLPYFRDAVAR
jgi:dTDP-glucose 4,6-dehydratase